ncbi:unnamed protein product [Ambrosiozyma monospora]|uniref:Unnamed protein product n=1 Tax=Ambrosiozyma monospora TaxID=43982 RepID=A0ACB5TCA8_AMBMO|nr:unnamed protein product [Ambrosiozyma monospora]
MEETSFSSSPDKPMSTPPKSSTTSSGFGLLHRTLSAGKSFNKRHSFKKSKAKDKLTVSTTSSTDNKKPPDPEIEELSFDDEQTLSENLGNTNTYSNKNILYTTEADSDTDFFNSGTPSPKTPKQPTMEMNTHHSPQHFQAKEGDLDFYSNYFGNDGAFDEKIVNGCENGFGFPATRPASYPLLYSDEPTGEYEGGMSGNDNFYNSDSEDDELIKHLEVLMEVRKERMASLRAKNPRFRHTQSEMPLSRKGSLQDQTIIEEDEEGEDHELAVIEREQKIKKERLKEQQQRELDELHFKQQQEKLQLQQQQALEKQRTKEIQSQQR